MVDFSTVLQRADDETLQKIIGRKVAKVLNALDPTLIRPKRLREVIVNVYSSEGLLDDKSVRNELIDLLRPSEAESLCELIGDINAKSFYEDLKSLNIRANSKKEKLLYNFFEIPYSDKNISKTPPIFDIIKPEYAMFNHQRVATKKLDSILFNGDKRRVLLHMPTGSGKTRTTMNLISSLLRKYEPSLVLWMAYSEELCIQATDEFQKAWEYLGDREIPIYRYWGSNEIDFSKIKEGLVVSSLSKLTASVNKSLKTIGQLGVNSNLIVFDEAHQSIAPTYQFVLKALLSHDDKTALLGLSATPGRTWNEIEEDEKLSKFFHSQKVTLEIPGYNNPVEYLVDEGYLANANYKKLFVKSGIKLTPEEIQQINTELELPASIANRLEEDETRNLAIVESLKKLLRRHERVIFFAMSVGHSESIAKILQALDYNAQSITSNTGAKNRKKWIASFKSETEKPMVLCNYGVLTTGFDAPRTSAALIARPTKSLVLYSQMVGRAIRGVKAKGNNEAEIVTVIDSDLPGFGSVAQAFTNWEDVWSNK